MKCLIFLLPLLLTVTAHNTHTTTKPHHHHKFMYTQAPDDSVLTKLTANVKTMINSNKGSHGGHTGAGHSGHILSMIPKIVRLVFHDCVGGCDGCINLHNPGNRGLSNVQSLLDKIYAANFSTSLSRADFYVNSAMVALSIGVTNTPHTHARRILHGGHSHAPSFRFTWGRMDCSTSPMTMENRTFPQGTGNTHHVLHYFNNEFGLTTKETVALMGAHTLGRATLDNSGFRGPWVVNEDILNNQYYRELLYTKTWVQQQNPKMNMSVPAGGNPHHGHNRRLFHNHGTNMTNMTHNMGNWQWNNQSLMMLNADMALIRQFHMMPLGKVNCTYSTCPNSMSTINYVQLYADNNIQWQNDFEKVFAKITKKTTMNLVIYNVSASTALPTGCSSMVCKPTTTTAMPKMTTTNNPNNPNTNSTTNAASVVKFGGSLVFASLVSFLVL